MEGQSKFLPDSISGALKRMVYYVFGVVLIIFGVWALGALCFYNPYLTGFNAAGTFGNQSVMGQIVGLLRYGVGAIPAVFILLGLIRFGLSWVAKWDECAAPEYNLLRGFVAMCLGSVGFGLVAPSSSFGGVFGVIAANDIISITGGFGLLIGLICLAGFFLLAGALLNIKLRHIAKTVKIIVRALRWILSVFHLTGALPAQQKFKEYVSQGLDEEEPLAGSVPDFTQSIPKSVPVKKSAPAKIPASSKRAASSAQSKRFMLDSGNAYELPSPAFLERSNFGKNIVTPELKRNAAAMEVHFSEYGVRGKVLGIRPGPIVTLYEFMPDSGVRMVDVSKTVKDMTRAMATENIRIAHIPSTQLIGVEMVNLNRQTVRFQSLIDNPSFVNSKYRIPLALGVDIGGNPMYFDLAKMPHVLIAGRTGSGKSVFVQSIITSIVYHFTPDACKLLIIDPKGVDFNLWDDIPHLITPVVKLDPVAAVNALKWSVAEMEDRYKKLQSMGVQNIEGYNDAVSKKRNLGEVMTRQVAVGTDPETGELEFETQEIDLSNMPYMVIVIDEVADLMSVARKDVEACVQRLAQKARAAGIHLVMATQRPDATTITGVIKANFPTRISFQARSNIDSMTTLGEKGAENLLACGDMLFSEAGRVPVRIHGAFIENTEINKVADFLRSQGVPDFVSGITDGGDGGGEMSVVPGMASSKESKNSDLYSQAKEYVIRDKKPTISYIQRRLGIGYNKAAGFMEQMEADGVVSPPDANNKRHIL